MFTRSQNNYGGGKMDKFGNNYKNVFCKLPNGKKGDPKGYLEIDGRLYGISVGLGGVDKKGNQGVWVRLTEYQRRGNNFQGGWYR